jgi:hypothetical protein
MTQYRIKINTLYNGNKEYVPQVSKITFFGKWGPRAEILWSNICRDDSGGYFISETMSNMYSTEDAALKAIESYKQQLENDNSRKVKSTSYKEIK